MDFIGRLTTHAASSIMEQVLAWDDPCELRADKVGAWLMNEEATVWDEARETEQSAMGMWLLTWFVLL